MAQSPALRVGLIGCGFFATNHIHAWLGLEGATIAAICDTDPQRLAVAASMVGADVLKFSDAARLMASGVCDFVDIATSPSTHCALVLEAARHRMPAIVQKPMAPDLGRRHQHGRGDEPGAGAVHGAREFSLSKPGR